MIDRNYREPQSREPLQLDRFGHFLGFLGHFAGKTWLNLGHTYYHQQQQYLAKNPGGYCSIGGTGVSCPIGLGV
ncbi:MAG: hypothetical protein ACI9K2_002193 [Myxococcota bacterium]|jgi:hypothetical protein